MIHHLQPLIEQLRHPDASQRSQAVFALDQLQAEKRAELLLTALVSEPDLYVREDIVWALVRMGEAVVDPLQALLHDSEPTVRHQAAHALGKLKAVRALPFLIQALTDRDPRVLVKVIHAIGQLGDTEAVPPLVQQLGHDNRDVQEMLTTVLEQFGAIAIEPLRQALTHERWQVREQAADVLGLIGAPDAVSVLVAALQDDAWQVRFALITALDRLDSREAVPSADADARVQALIATVLARRGQRT